MYVFSPKNKDFPPKKRFASPREASAKLQTPSRGVARAFTRLQSPSRLLGNPFSVPRKAREGSRAVFHTRDGLATTREPLFTPAEGARLLAKAFSEKKKGIKGGIRTFAFLIFESGNMAKAKYYVVWQGVVPGVYDNWAACKTQIDKQPGAKYKSFETREEAQEAFANGPESYLKPRHRTPSSVAAQTSVERPLGPCLCVDAACSGNPGDMEYRGVYLPTGQEIFRIGPYRKGTNNIGEFLALVHGLALLQQKGSTIPIYSDSRNAIGWVKQKQCKTKLERLPENEPIFDLIERAERWLQTHTYTTPILKWDTSAWGEIPADFGRK